MRFEVEKLTDEERSFICRRDNRNEEFGISRVFVLLLVIATFSVPLLCVSSEYFGHTYLESLMLALSAAIPFAILAFWLDRLFMKCYVEYLYIKDIANKMNRLISSEEKDIPIQPMRR